VIALWLLACSEYTVREDLPVEPADPPGDDDDGVGQAPDWTDCEAGYEGAYFNLPGDHADLDPEGAPDPAADWADRDWWSDDYAAFERVDTTLDHGPSWWPVDEGLAGDPDYFAVHWVTWMRVLDDDDPVSVIVGASDDLWLDVDGETLYSAPGVHDYAPTTVELALEVGQVPLEIRYAHRGGPGGFSLRLAGDNVTACRPDHE